VTGPGSGVGPRSGVGRGPGVGPGVGRGAASAGAAPPRRVHLAAYLPGTHDTGGQSGFASVRHLARIAERGRFDFLLLDQDLRPRADAEGGCASLTVLNALAAVTGHLGLAATVDAAGGEPRELARCLASLDHLSGGRAAWHVGPLPPAEGGPARRAALAEAARPEDGRPDRADECVEVTRALWRAWPPGSAPRTVRHSGPWFDLTARPALPPSPQGHPVVIRGAGSDGAREAAARTADVVLTGHTDEEAGRALRADLGRRLTRYGRPPGALKVMAVAAFVLGETEDEARRKRAAHGPGTAPRPCLAGTPASLAATLDAYVRAEAADGFVLTPLLAPDGLDEFVDLVVPLLQRRGVYRAAYEGPTLRDHLGLEHPAAEAGRVAAGR
jgi:alkanesulfonate monooxygenase SsuD/methylene tetrahydromethanopterin reductase-like flavin-dependent oxidoreductase (luciferase family)